MIRSGERPAAACGIRRRYLRPRAGVRARLDIRATSPDDAPLDARRHLRRLLRFGCRGAALRDALVPPDGPPAGQHRVGLGARHGRLHGRPGARQRLRDRAWDGSWRARCGSSPPSSSSSGRRERRSCWGCRALAEVVGAGAVAPAGHRRRSTPCACVSAFVLLVAAGVGDGGDAAGPRALARSARLQLRPAARAPVRLEHARRRRRRPGGRGLPDSHARSDRHGLLRGRPRPAGRARSPCPRPPPGAAPARTPLRGGPAPARDADRSPRRSWPACCCWRSRSCGSACSLLFVWATSGTFAIMLAIVLLGIGAGGLLASRLARPAPGDAQLAGPLALAAGAATVLSYRLLEHALPPPDAGRLDGGAHRPRRVVADAARLHRLGRALHLPRPRAARRGGRGRACGRPADARQHRGCDARVAARGLRAAPAASAWKRRSSCWPAPMPASRPWRRGHRPRRGDACASPPRAAFAVVLLLFPFGAMTRALPPRRGAGGRRDRATAWRRSRRA